MIYSKGKKYGEYNIRMRFLVITWATQRNISGTYTKYIQFPGFSFARNYMGAQLKIFRITIFNAHTRPGDR